MMLFSERSILLFENLKEVEATEVEKEAQKKKVVIAKHKEQNQYGFANTFKLNIFSVQMLAAIRKKQQILKKN